MVTPVSIYLKLRDKLTGVILLESSNYHGEQNSFSYICCNPIASFSLKEDTLHVEYPNGKIEDRKIDYKKEAIQALSDFRKTFVVEDQPFKFISNGLFGYMSYDAVQHFEDIRFSEEKPDEYKIPDILYKVYRNVIAINHFKNEMYIFDHTPEGEAIKGNLEDIVFLIKGKNFPYFDFTSQNNEGSNLTDEAYREIVTKGIGHCHRGDVFQIVLSRRFHSGFSGDEFNVYRALRAINPSPYLFYFDYGSFKIFGSSPEALVRLHCQRRIGADRGDGRAGCVTSRSSPRR